MFASIFLDLTLPNAASWFYFSFLLSHAVFFKFDRLLTLRNWDLVTLYLLVPGLLLLMEAPRAPEQTPPGVPQRPVAAGACRGIVARRPGGDPRAVGPPPPDRVHLADGRVRVLFRAVPVRPGAREAAGAAGQPEPTGTRLARGDAVHLPHGRGGPADAGLAATGRPRASGGDQGEGRGDRGGRDSGGDGRVGPADDDVLGRARGGDRPARCRSSRPWS